MGCIYVSRPTTLTERERALLRVGRAIATGDESALDAYFAKDFEFQGPDGDSTYPELKAFFASWRRTFANFACERRHVMSIQLIPVALPNDCLRIDLPWPRVLIFHFTHAARVFKALTPLV